MRVAEVSGRNERNEIMQTRTIIVAAAAMLLAAGAANADDVFNMGPGLTSQSFVTVGNPGNAADVIDDPYGNPQGSVGYTYQMGQYDVTAAQYCQFLNSVASTDPYSLYNINMAGGPGSGACGVNRTGSPGSYSYNITSGYSVKNGNFPVNFVSWGDAARFSNWLTNGQPNTGVENLTTTENGSYYLNGATTAGQLTTVIRTASAIYVIPTENEWYKAAYYDPSLNGGEGGYWAYPTKSNTEPTNVFSSTGTNNANYYFLSGGSSDPTNYLTVVGDFADSQGPYNTYDMGGDVFQWNEMIVGGLNRGQRGGSFDISGLDLQSGFGTASYPLNEDSDVGFRVAEVPEPATMAILVLGVLTLLRRRNQGTSSGR
jgi:formylglycine-generating enzyme required for sulfatase activity